ncbi:hypothetical protein BY458DRAFT_496941 [Sporodiniella umbellata]|nr:hypothetical protein BY458DRAFT_496941 [Sporodiniella umbellata]
MEVVHKSNTLPQSDFVDAVRSSCRSFVESSQVKVSKEGIGRFLQALDPEQYKELAYDSTIHLPVKFTSVEEELNFVALIDLLNFGSGYRMELHQAVERGAFDTIRYGVMAMHIGGMPMDAKTWKEIDVFKVAETFQFPIEQEKRHETLDFVTLTEPTPLKPLAVGIVNVLNTTGDYLSLHGYPDLATFILRQTREHPLSAKALTEALVRALPGLHDHYSLDGKSVCLFKKAQILVYHLWFTMRHKLPEFDFTDIDELTIFADNVIPTMLAHLGVLEMPQSWLDTIHNNQDLSESMATTLRAASVVACDDLVKASNGLLTTGGLDVYLWRLGKVGDYRKVPRFQLKDTVMF